MCISCTGRDGDVQGSKFDESTEVITESGSSLNGEKEKLSQRTKTRGLILIAMAVDRLLLIIYLILTVLVTAAILCNHPYVVGREMEAASHPNV